MSSENATDHPLSGVMADIFAKEPEQREVYFCLDRDLRHRVSSAQQKLQATKFRSGQSNTGDGKPSPEVADLQAELDALLEEAKGRLITFTFSAIDPQEYDNLRSAHLPTPAQLTKARQEERDRPDFNVDTFPPAIVSAACTKVVGPSGKADGLPLETVQEMWKSPAYNDAERAMLSNAANGVQFTATVIDVPKGV